MFSCQKALQPTLNFSSQLNLSNLPISCPLVVKHALLEMPYRWFSHSKPSLPSGKRLHTYGKSPCYIFMDKSTISTGPFSIAFCMFTRPGIVFLQSMFFLWFTSQLSLTIGKPETVRSPRKFVAASHGLRALLVLEKEPKATEAARRG